MSAEHLDELGARRADRLQASSGDHRSRLAYDSFVAGLEDADRVIDDLEAVGAGQLLIPAPDLEFTIRRLRTLIRGAVVSARKAGVK